MRKFKRSPVESVGIALVNNSPSEIRIKDFSRMGLSFLSEKPLQPKSFVSVMYQNETNQIIQMKVYIKNSITKSDQSFRIGALFVGLESRT